MSIFDGIVKQEATKSLFDGIAEDYDEDDLADMEPEPDEDPSMFDEFDEVGESRSMFDAIIENRTNEDADWNDRVARTMTLADELIELRSPAN